MPVWFPEAPWAMSFLSMRVTLIFLEASAWAAAEPASPAPMTIAVFGESVFGGVSQGVFDE